MIQGAINQLLTMGAAIKKADEMTASRARSEQRAIERHEAYMNKARNRMRQSVQAKYNQNKEYQKFLASLGNPNVPDIVTQVAFDAMKNQPEVRIGKDKVDISKMSPEAQRLLRGIK